MKEHKYKMGQFIHLDARMSSAAPAGRYQVVRLLPPQDNENQYRVRFVDDGHERVVKESSVR